MTSQDFQINGLDAGQAGAGIGPAGEVGGEGATTAVRGGRFGPGKLRALCGGGGNLLLVGLFAAGIACVYFLSLRGGPTKASAEQVAAESKVDIALQQLDLVAGAGERDKAQAVVDAFYYEAKQRQIPLADLKRNAFVFEPAGRTGISRANPADPSFKRPDPSAVAQSEALDAVRRLRLQSVMAGPRGATAMVSNNLLAEGQSINGWTVVKIKPTEVVLQWNDQQYVLKMDL